MRPIRRSALPDSAGALTAMNTVGSEKALRAAGHEALDVASTRSARLAVEAAARVVFENIDENNILLIKAPVSGVVTDVPLAQRGDKIQSATPV